MTYIHFSKKVNIKIPETVPLIELLYRLTNLTFAWTKCLKVQDADRFGRCTLRKFPKEVIIRLKILKQFTTPIFNNTYIFQIGEQVTVFFFSITNHEHNKVFENLFHTEVTISRTQSNLARITRLRMQPVML